MIIYIHTYKQTNMHCIFIMIKLYYVLINVCKYQYRNQTKKLSRNNTQFGSHQEEETLTFDESKRKTTKFLKNKVYILQ